MPSKSPAQAKLMRAVAHGWRKPGGGGPTRAVAKEFINSDRRTKVQGYNFGGAAMGRSMYGGMNSRGPLSRDPRAAPMGGQRPPMKYVNRMNPRAAPPTGGPRPQTHINRMDPRAAPPQSQRGGLGQVGQQMMRQGVGPPGRQQMTPPRPQRGYPGGGNPMTGGRNPMMRQVNQRRPMMRGRAGPTSYLR